MRGQKEGSRKRKAVGSPRALAAIRRAFGAWTGTQQASSVLLRATLQLHPTRQLSLWWPHPTTRG